jgi:predicted anti-sigma-YlaC factor YlaD
MCKQDDIVSYLYDELDSPSRASVEAHLRGCADCRTELASLQSLRTDLTAWTPPAPDFAFRIVNEPNVIRPNVAAWRSWITPAAGLAAAAVLVLAAAAGLARIEVHNGPDGFTLRTGASAGAAVETARATLGSSAHDVYLPSADDGAFGVLERRINALEAASRGDANLRNASTLSARSSDEEILRVVRDLLAQSETRQKGELAFRVAQVMRDINMQRTADLNGVQRRIGTIDASVTEEAVAHRELMNYILASSKQK